MKNKSYESVRARAKMNYTNHLIVVTVERVRFVIGAYGFFRSFRRIHIDTHVYNN